MPRTFKERFNEYYQDNLDKGLSPEQAAIQANEDTVSYITFDQDYIADAFKDDQLINGAGQ